MTTIARLLICLGIYFVPITLFSEAASDTRRQHMLGDIDVIKSSFRTNYAQLEWKKEYCGWDLDSEISKLKNKVLEAEDISTKQFQYLLKEFFYSIKDYHVTAQFYSTESALLPFIVQSANGRYFFSHIDHRQLKGAREFPFEVGDEIILFDGQPVAQVAEELRVAEVGVNQERTDRAIADLYLTTRFGCFGHVVPKGPIAITAIKKGESMPITYQLEWDYAHEKIPGVAKSIKALVKSTPALSKQSLVGKHSFFQKRFVWPKYKALAKAHSADIDPAGLLGSHKSFVPVLGKVLWETPRNCSFYAYLFELPQGRTGAYIRIPTYEADAEQVAIEFEEIIKKFEKESDVLVVDQVNNPGGLVLYMYALASMLTDRPLDVPKHRQMITQEDVFFAHSELADFEAVENDDEAKFLLGETLEGIPVTYEIIQSLIKHFRFIIDEWEAGRNFTKESYVYGIGPLNPHPHGHYSKPILVLVNEMDFSGGDFFPAILQDNARATIFGSRTAGAGGYISRTVFSNLSGIAEFCYTGSLAVRAQQGIIENHGVTPDVYYEVSDDDLQNNYSTYVQKVLQTLEKM